MGNGFEEFYGEIEAEARAEGPAAVRDLRAKELKYSLINSLITRRHQMHLTQGELAVMAGVAQAEISRIERGRKSPTMDTYSRIAAALDIRLVPARRRRARLRDKVA
jgi:XRE family transcriptional regulator, regulator of sulfur utilization